MKGSGNWPSLVVAQQNFYSSFRLAQTFLAFARESNAVLKQLEALLERQVAVFQLTDDLFERLERSFKRPSLFLTIFHFSRHFI